jgi:hypothetical protein
LFPESVKAPRIRQKLQDNCFGLLDFLIVQGLEFFLPPPLLECPAILPDEHYGAPGKPISPSFPETIPASTVTPVWQGR